MNASPPPFLPLCTLFQWGPLCMEALNIFLETFFFSPSFVEGLHTFSRESSGGWWTGTVSHLCGLTVTVADFLECESKRSVWRRPSVAETLVIRQSWLGCCHYTFTYPVEVRREPKMQFFISSVQPTHTFPWKPLFVFYEGTLGFLRYLRVVTFA